MKRISVFFLALVVFLGLVFQAEAAVPRGDRERPLMRRGMLMGMRMVENNLYPPSMLLRLAEEIGLTEDQEGKIRDMELRYKEIELKQQAEIRIQSLKLRNMLSASKVDRKAVDRAILSISKLRADIQLARINHLLDVRALLTPEQKEKIEEGKKKMRRRFWHRNTGGARPGRPMPPQAGSSMNR